MKKINILLSGLILMTIASCTKEYSSDDYGGYEMLSQYMLENWEKGAALRTISQSGGYSYFDLASSNWGVTLEPHDKENGGLTESVDWYVSNGGNNETMVKTISKSEMTTGEVGLPNFSVSMSLAEASALTGPYNGGDTILHRFVLNLSDGNSYSSNTVTGPLTGSYFRSPFQYPVIITCVLPAGEVEAVAGTYTISVTDSYGDGWSTGEAIVVNVDGTEYRFGSTVTSPSTVSNTGNDFADGDAYTWTFEVKESAQKMTWNWYSGFYDDEIAFKISHTSPSGKTQDVVSYGAYPNGSVDPGTMKPLSGMSICK
jgi:hypothetical protein